MRIIKKIKKVMISAIMAIMLLPKKIFASFDPSTFEELYGPPTEILYGPPELMDEPTFIESIWRMVKTCILPISLAIIFIVGSIIFFKKSKATTKEKIITLILILFIITIIISIGWGIYYVITNII